MSEPLASGDISLPNIYVTFRIDAPLEIMFETQFSFPLCKQRFTQEPNPKLMLTKASKPSGPLPCSFPIPRRGFSISFVRSFVHTFESIPRPPHQQFSANAACRCRKARTNAVDHCRPVPRRSPQRSTRTRTAFSATSSSRSADIRSPATPWCARGFRCPARICHNEIHRSAWPQGSRARQNLKSIP